MVVAPHHASEIEVATLVKLRVPGLPEIRVQNYQLDEKFFYQGEDYDPLDFEIGGVTRQLDLSNSSTTIVLGNRSASYDGLLPIRQMLRNHDGWRRAKITAIVLFLDRPDYSPIVNRLQILGSSIANGQIELRIKSAIEAINAQVPTSILTRNNAPELPQFASSNRF